MYVDLRDSAWLTNITSNLRVPLPYLVYTLPTYFAAPNAAGPSTGKMLTELRDIILLKFCLISMIAWQIEDLIQNGCRNHAKSRDISSVKNILYHISITMKGMVQKRNNQSILTDTHTQLLVLHSPGKTKGTYEIKCLMIMCLVNVIHQKTCECRHESESNTHASWFTWNKQFVKRRKLRTFNG